MNFTNHRSLSTHRLITHSSQERDPSRSPTTLLSGLPTTGAVPEGMMATGGEAQCFCKLVSCFPVTRL